jgi:hypothetical protein
MLAAATLALLPGCAAVIVGGAAAAGTVAYVRGELQANVDGSIPKTAQAVNRAFTQLKFSKISEVGDALTLKIKGRTGQDEAVTVVLEKITDLSTRVRIRVGTFGDQTRSSAILEEIKRGL